MDEIILASGSPRRRELLSAAEVHFEVFTADTDEETSLTVPQEVVATLSERKATAVWNLRKEDLPLAVIGADTIVAWEGEILGKPHDEADAFSMLTHLSGKTHQVYTGVTVLYRKKGEVGKPEEIYKRLTFVEGTDVTFYPVSEEVIRRYIATGEPMDKAGAYGIQGLFGLFTAGIQGDIQNVIGLPVPRLLHEATKVGLCLSPWQGGEIA